MKIVLIICEERSIESDYCTFVKPSRIHIFVGYFYVKREESCINAFVFDDSAEVN